MKRKLQIMVLMLLGIVLSINQVWAAEGDEVASLSVATLAGSSTSYSAYSNDDWVMTVCSNTVFGTNAKSGNDGKLKLSNSSGTSTINSAIASAIATYTNSTFTTETQYVSALIGKTNLSNVGKVTLTYSGTNSGTPDKIWVLASTDGSNYSVVASTTTMTSTITLSFSTITTAKYAIVAQRSSSWGLKGTPTFKFFEGAGSGNTSVSSTPKVIFYACRFR